MISEYHLTCLSQGSSCISPVLPEAAKDLLPPIEECLASDSFQGTRDLRVVEKAKTLWVAVWLHCLDMAAAEDGTASSFLDVTRHGRGPLLEFILAPQTSSLTFEEVVQRVLAENWYKTESSLDNVQKLQLDSKESSRTSLRLTKQSLTNLPKRRLREIWNRDRKTSKALRSPYLIMKPASEGPRFNQKKPWPVKMIHPTLGPRVLERWRWLLPW